MLPRSEHVLHLVEAALNAAQHLKKDGATNE
jgi:hypothetical protein